MNTSQVRDLVMAYLTMYGAGQTTRIPKAIIDNMVNVEMQRHFSDVKSQHAYWHTIVSENMDEYDLPDGLISPTMIKVANERYYPAQFPYIEDAKRSSGGRTRITDEGVMVDTVGDRWYWVIGDKIHIYPAPKSTTAADVTGTCTVATSILTIVSGSMGSANAYRNRLIMVGSTYYIILSHSTTTIVCDGTLPIGATTYTIYKQGLEIWGVERPTAITIGGDDSIPGNDIDANAIALQCAYNVGMTLPLKKGIDFGGLAQLAKDYKRRSLNDHRNKTAAPIVMQPWGFRSDQAGNK